MPQPTPWAPSLVYTTYAAAHPSAPFPPASVDTDFAALKLTLDGILTNLALIQRDDGALANLSVGVQALGKDVKNLIGGWNPRGAWVTATNYAVKDMVTPTGGDLTYVCAVANTSGATFAADLALGYWQLVNGGSVPAITAASINLTQSDILVGRATAGAGTGEEISLTATGRTVISQASIAALNTALGLGTASSPTFANITDSGLTANRVVLAGTAGLLTGSSFLNYSLAINANSDFGVGIGVATPLAALHVKNSSGIGNSGITVESTAGASTLGLTNPTDTATILQYNSGSEHGFQFNSVAAGQFLAILSSLGLTISSARNLQWGVASANPDAAFGLQASGSIMQFCPGANAGPQKFGVANTYTDGAHYESACISWSSNRAQFGTEKVGSGLAREMSLMIGGSQAWVIQTAATGSLGTIYPSITNTQDIGLSGTNLIRTLYVGTSVVLPTGTLFGLASKSIASAQTLTTQTALQNATGLSFSIGANEEWLGTFELQFTNSIATTGVKVAVTTPSGCTQLIGASLIPQNYGAGNSGYLNTTVSGTALDFTAAAEVGVNGAGVIVRCRIKNGATPGTVQLQFAQSTSSATVLSLDAGSFMCFVRSA